jgi:hypothetical protein
VAAEFDRITRENGAAGLRDGAVALPLAPALERITQDQGAAAEDMVDVVRRMTTRAVLPRVPTPDG